MAWQWIAAAGLSLLSGSQNRRAARSAKNTEEAFLQKKFDEYDLPLYNMQKDKLKADWNEMVRSIKLQQKNELKLAAFKDKNNLRNYQQQLKIRDFEHNQNLKLYNKSEDLFQAAVGLNLEGAISAKQQEVVQLRETEKSYAFQNEDAIIESIQKKGELAAKGQAGRSNVKQRQSLLADLGRNQAIMSESIVSANRNTRMRLADIARQHKAADIQAASQRMFKPTKAPDPLKPLDTPVADYEMPRALQDFDFGPEPLKGVSTVQVPSMFSVLTNAVGAGFSQYAASTAGTSSFDPYRGTQGKGGFSFANLFGNKK